MSRNSISDNSISSDDLFARSDVSTSSSVEEFERIYFSPWPETRLVIDRTSVWEAVCNPPKELLALTPFNRIERDDLPALSDGFTRATWTYKELRIWTTSLAFGLVKKLGVQSNDKALLCMPASAHSIVLYLSVLRAGAIAVLCNPGYTILELEHALNVVEPQVIIGPTQICDCIASIYTTMGKPFPKFAITDRCSLVKRDHISYISDFWQLSKGYSSKAEAHFARLNWKPVSWTETATMAFSSGTSGMPKAVEISHKALISLYLAARPTGCFNMTKQEKTLIPIPTFHVGGLSFWLQASIKGDHCIFTSSSPFSLVSFAEICLKWRCQRLIMVPAILHGLLKSGLAEQLGQAKYLTYVMIGAAPLGPLLQEKGAKALGVRLVQGYGMTETAGGIIRSSLTHASKPGSIGTLGAGNYARIVDDQGRDTKHCEVAGELLLRGDSLMNGYYRNQDATNKTIDKQGWLHTGDQAYIDSITGDIFIVDRIKELIKYKGFQISPSELEAVLLSNDKNLEAAVVALKNRDTLEEYPCAYIVARGQSTHHLGEELHTLVNTKLSNYKRLRGGILFVPSLPKTGSNKIRRDVLHAWAKTWPSISSTDETLYMPYNHHISM